MIRKHATTKGVKTLYPSYKHLVEAKTRCYPPNEEDLVINELEAEIKLQAVVDLTVSRLCLAQEIAIKEYYKHETFELNNLTITFKWGCDGSGGQNRYKQMFEKSSNDDSHVLATSLVPLQLYGQSRQRQQKCNYLAKSKDIIYFVLPADSIQISERNEEEIVNEFQYIRDQIKVTHK